jgi:hypothetical protein
MSSRGCVLPDPIGSRPSEMPHENNMVELTELNRAHDAHAPNGPPHLTDSSSFESRAPPPRLLPPAPPLLPMEHLVAAKGVDASKPGPDSVQHPARALKGFTENIRQTLESDRFANMDNLSRDEVLGMDPQRLTQSYDALEKQLLAKKKELMGKKWTTIGPDSRAALAEVDKTLAAIQKARDNVKLKFEPLRNLLMRGTDVTSLQTRGDALAHYQGTLVPVTPSLHDSETNLKKGKFGGFLGWGAHRATADELNRAVNRLAQNPHYNPEKLSAFSQRDLDFANRYDLKQSQRAELDRLDSANEALRKKQNSRIRNGIAWLYNKATGRQTDYARSVENYQALKKSIANAREAINVTLPSLKENADRLLPQKPAPTTPVSFESQRSARDLNFEDVTPTRVDPHEQGVEMTSFTRASEPTPAPATAIQLVDLGAADAATASVTQPDKNPAQVLLAYAQYVNGALKDNKFFNLDKLSRSDIVNTKPGDLARACSDLEQTLLAKRKELVAKKTTTLGPDTKRALAEIDSALARVKQAQSDIKLKFEPLHNLLTRGSELNERGSALAFHGADALVPATPSGDESEAVLSKGKFGGFLGWGAHQETARELNRARTRLEQNPYFNPDSISAFSRDDLNFANDYDLKKSQVSELDRLSEANENLRKKQNSRFRNAAAWLYNKATGRTTDYARSVENYNALKGAISDARDRVNVTLPFLKASLDRLQQGS